MKNNKKLIGVLACVVLACVLAGGVLLYGKATFPTSPQDYSTVFDESSFPTDLYRYSQSLYWKLQQKEQDNFTLTPTETLFPGFSSVDMLDYAEGEEGFSEEDWHSAASYAEQRGEELIDSANSTLNSWYHSFETRWQGLEYLVLDTKTGSYLGTWNDDLVALARNNAGSDTIKALQAKYRYYAVLRFGEDGQLGLPTVYGAAQDTFDTLQYHDALQDMKENGNVNHDLWEYIQPYYQGPSNIAVVFTVSNDNTILNQRFYTDLYITDLGSIRATGLPSIYLLATVLAAVGAILLLRSEKWPLADIWFAKLPPELAIIGIPIAIGSYEVLVEDTLISLYRGDYTASIASGGVFQFLAGGLATLFVLALIALVMCGVESLAMSFWQIKTLGFKGYFVGKSWLMWFFNRFRSQIMALYRWFTRIDLTEKSNTTLFKILGLNFAILTLFCSIWYFGIFGLIIYTVVLFFILRRYLDRLKKQYAVLLAATKQMAEGNLNVAIGEDLGVFDPLKDELVKVQEGFQSAVAAETKSQNMKTELITNVSHDLKTPLTAIITYVNLLKNEDISPEERQSFVKTLDLKSQRLKRLIEDLFEMSKASSKDITLNLSQVDLPALIRQVELEAKDELDAAGIEFRYNYPLGQKVEMRLDGEKTSRAFENLILNVAKYGMSGTRAYVTVVAGERLVTIEMKNVSRDELNFDNEEITERFVRGDLSRSTEGSGLGLAIAKSFVEAQGGQFKIVTDGDMFKAYITFPRQPEPGLEREGETEAAGPVFFGNSTQDPETAAANGWPGSAPPTAGFVFTPPPPPQPVAPADTTYPPPAALPQAAAPTGGSQSSRFASGVIDTINKRQEQLERKAERLAAKAERQAAKAQKRAAQLAERAVKQAEKLAAKLERKNQSGYIPPPQELPPPAPPPIEPPQEEAPHDTLSPPPG